MAKKATGKRTPSRILWEVIDAERARQGMTCEKLSDIAGFPRSTVITDKQDPDKITLYRLWCYLAALEIRDLFSGAIESALAAVKGETA